ncbi:MAG: hypothetical protein ACSHYA_10880 [Opitutaceae bacterium]
MRYVTAFFIFMTALVLNAKETDYNEPFVVKAANGAVVEVVAVYSMNADGMTFSPHPKGPLIGSKKLAVMTTPWANIDVASLQAYKVLNDAYVRALAGESVDLDIGVHFNDLSEIKKRLESAIPNFIVYYQDGTRVKLPLTKFVTDKNVLRAKHWSVKESDKQKLVEEWGAIYKELEPMIYRPEVSQFQFDLEKSLKIISRLDSESSTFNVSSARELKNFVLQL